MQVLQEQEQATEEEQGVTQCQELEDPIDRGVLCVQVLQEQEQATEEEQGVTQCQELEDPIDRGVLCVCRCYRSRSRLLRRSRE